MSTTDAPSVELGQMLRAWREAADMRLEDLSVRVSDRLPRAMRISRETIRRYESGQLEYRALNPIVIAAMAVATGHGLNELPQTVRDDVDRILELGDPEISSIVETTRPAALAPAC